MTPPFNISAKPVFNRRPKLPLSSGIKRFSHRVQQVCARIAFQDFRREFLNLPETTSSFPRLAAIGQPPGTRPCVEHLIIYCNASGVRRTLDFRLLLLYLLR
jgi:hypothetical protein